MPHRTVTEPVLPTSSPSGLDINQEKIENSVLVCALSVFVFLYPLHPGSVFFCPMVCIGLKIDGKFNCYCRLNLHC